MQYRDIILKTDNSILNVRIHAKTPKEVQIKSTIFGQNEDEDLCPVKTVFEIIKSTAPIRQDLLEYHTLFPTHLGSQKQSTSAKPATVANCIKSAMKGAGINTNSFQAHSLRAASSTKAVELGHSVQDIKKHANWNLNSNTFEKLHYKPSSQSLSSTSISNSIFSFAEKRITSKVKAKATVLGLGMIINTNNVETKTKDVIHIHP